MKKIKILNKNEYAEGEVTGHAIDRISHTMAEINDNREWTKKQMSPP